MLPGAFAGQNPGLSWPPPFKTLSEPCQVWCCHWNKLDNTCNVGKQLLCVIPPERGQNPRTKGDFAFVLRAVALFSSVQPNMGTPHTHEMIAMAEGKGCSLSTPGASHGISNTWQLCTQTLLCHAAVQNKALQQSYLLSNPVPK